MNKVYAVFSGWCGNDELYGLYASLEGAKDAIEECVAGEDGEWTSEHRFEVYDGGDYYIEVRTVKP